LVISLIARCVGSPRFNLGFGKWGGGQVLGNVVENLVRKFLLFGDSFVVVQNLDSLGKGEESEKEGD